MPSVLGIDLGLSGTRAAVMDTGGRVLGHGRAYRTDMEGAGGEMMHHPAGWTTDMAAAARAALASAEVGNVDAVAVGAFGPVPVVLDRDLQPISPVPISSLDPVGARLEAWRRDAPALFERAAWVVDVTGYLVSTLVGRPVMDTITASDHEPVGERVAPRPEPDDALAVAGGLTRDAAGRLGLVAGTPVTVGTYDTFVDLAGLGVREVGDAGLLLGSTLNIGVIRTDAEAPPGLRASRHVGAGWFVGGWTSSAGRALDWCLGLFPASDRASIEDAAGRLAPGAGGLVTLPYLDGERAPVWDPLARGAVLGLRSATTPAQLYRSVLDGVALTAADLARRLRSVRHPSRTWCVSGGGARNAAWVHATADALGEPLEVVDLGGAGGAARFGLRALGADAPPVSSRIVEPDASRHACAVELLEIGEGLYASLTKRMRSLGSLEQRASEASGHDR